MSEKRINILVVEDDAIIAMDISRSLKKAGYEVSDTASSADTAMKILNQNPGIQLAVLDIQIEGNINGIELAHIIQRKFEIPIIFLTSFTDDETLHKVKCFNPAGFLIKPIEAAELVTNVELALLRSQDEVPIAEAIEKVQNTSAFIRHNGALVKVNLADILYAEASDNYCYIHTTCGRYLLSQTLKSIEEKLDKERFMRVHRSYLVNLNAIEIINDDHLIINDSHITISRACKHELMTRISLL